ncbi:MAG: hypothetical protein LQ339_004549 [Xanthoria mediterranea]|nr:MAG: hypothetical protein LQ339_004549 [Xanthoria mediterranea]
MRQKSRRHIKRFLADWFHIQGLDAGERLPQEIDFIDSLDESEATERLDQLAHILDVIDPVVDHGYNERSKELDPDAIEPHTEGEDNEEISRLARTDRHPGFLNCRGGLADNASQFSGEDCGSDKASQHEGNGMEYAEESDLIHFLEHAPESHLSDEAWENERNEYPWRTWSEESTLFEASSVHEDRTSQFSLEAQPSDSLGRISIDCDDEDEDTHENSWEAALITDRSGRHDIPTCESRLVARSQWEELSAFGRRLEVEDVRPNCELSFSGPRPYATNGAQPKTKTKTKNQNQNSPTTGRLSTLPPLRSPLLLLLPTTEPTSAPRRPLYPNNRHQHPHLQNPPRPPQPFQTPQTQPHADPPAHNLQTVALVGEASLQSLPTKVLALLGAVEVVGRVVLGEVVDFLVRPREE